MTFFLSNNKNKLILCSLDLVHVYFIIYYLKRNYKRTLIALKSTSVTALIMMCYCVSALGSHTVKDSSMNISLFQHLEYLIMSIITLRLCLGLCRRFSFLAREGSIEEGH